MPEVVDHGETGYIVNTVEEAVDAVARCADLDSAGIRQVFEKRFSADRMVSDYEAIYAGMIQPETRRLGQIHERPSLVEARERTDAAFAATQ